MLRIPLAGTFNWPAAVSSSAPLRRFLGIVSPLGAALSFDLDAGVSNITLVASDQVHAAYAISHCLLRRFAHHLLIPLRILRRLTLPPKGHQTIPRSIWNVSHVQAITSLNLNHNKLKDLNGLERMINLETLMLDNNDLTLRCDA
jgi:Leucine-rich repeat (LRR) protein